MNKYVLSIFLFALFIRLIFALFYPQLEIKDDALTYDNLAYNLASEKEFSEIKGEPSCEVGPLYPFFLSLIYKVLGRSHPVVRIVQSFLGAITCLLIYFIAKRAYNPAVGLIAMGLTSAYPAFIAYSGLLLTETLFTALLSLTALFLLLGEETRQIKYWILSGLSIGMASLCRSPALLLPIAIFGCWLIFRIPKREFLPRCTAVILAMLFLVLPWTYRNYRQFNAFIPVAIGAGVLWLSNHPDTESVDRAGWHPDKEPLKSLIANKPPIEADKILFEKGLKNIKEYPLVFLKSLSRKAFFFWTGSNSEGFYGLNPSFVSTLREREYRIFFPKLILLLCKLLCLGLAALGLKSTIKAWRSPKIYLIAIIGYVSTVAVIFSVGTARHSMPVMPFVIIRSAAGILSIQLRLKS